VPSGAPLPPLESCRESLPLDVCDHPMWVSATSNARELTASIVGDGTSGRKSPGCWITARSDCQLGRRTGSRYGSYRPLQFGSFSITRTEGVAFSGSVQISSRPSDHLIQRFSG
jgi:hypothetical protein